MLAAEAARAAAPTVGMGDLSGVILSLALVVGFIFAAAWVVRRMPLGIGPRQRPVESSGGAAARPARALGARRSARRGAPDRGQPGRRVQRRCAARSRAARRKTCGRTHLRVCRIHHDHSHSAVASASLVLPHVAFGQSLPAVTVDQLANGQQTYSLSIQVLALMTALTVLPALVLSMTAFTRIVIVLAILRQALGTPQTPPNQVLIGLSLFLTLFVMTPGDDARVRRSRRAVHGRRARRDDGGHKRARAAARVHARSSSRARPRACSPISRVTSRSWARRKCRCAVLIPSFITSELKTAFQIGFLIFIPFLVIDLVVASVLMSMGMMMLSPMLISLPFKIMLFVLVDGWTLLVGTLAASFFA